MAKKRSHKAVKQPKAAIEPRMLTVKGAAAYLASSEWFVRSLVWNQKLPYLKFGHRLVFDRADLTAPGNWVCVECPASVVPETEVKITVRR